MKKAKKTKTKKAIIAVCSVLAAIALILVVYVLYIVISYERVEDNLTLEIKDGTNQTVNIGDMLKLVTYNIGFGAYSPDYSFFMDGGEHSRGLSKEAVEQNVRGAIDVINEENPDFIALQEVDVNGTRSYHINQTAMMKEFFTGFDSIYAQNYDSAYFVYPFNEPIGANEAGMMTFSAFNMTSAVRRSLPIEENFYKYLDLDRAYTVTEIPTNNGKALMLYNVHLSAYTSDGTIADEQLKMFVDDMSAEYKKGNYVIATGDFNKDVLGDSGAYFERSDGDYTWAKALDLSILPDDFLLYGGTNAPSCRNAEFPFRGDGTDFVLSVDGVIVSDNVDVITCKAIDTRFAYSDHNPVKCEFMLK